MSTGLKCDNCGTFFDAGQGSAVAVMVSDHHGFPHNEAPQWEHACTPKCAGALASKTAKLRAQEQADGIAHRAKIEREAMERKAADDAEYEKVREAVRLEEFRRRAQAEVDAIAPNK